MTAEDVNDFSDVRVLPYTEIDPRLHRPHPVRALDGATSYLNVQIAHDMGYRPLRVDVHVPEQGDGPFPVVLYVHGGGFVGGIKEIGPWGALPRHGIAVVSVEYRLAGEAKFPAAIRDVETALTWLVTAGPQFGLWTDRIALWGSSAGAYLAGGVIVGLAGTDSEEVITARSRVGGVVLHYPPVDFGHMLTEWHDRPDLADRLRGSMRALFGVDYAAPSDVPAHTSIVAAVAKADALPPFHLAHGDADTVVPVSQSVLLYETLRRHGVPAGLQVVPGEEHATAAFSDWPVVGPAVEFLRAAWGVPTAGHGVHIASDAAAGTQSIDSPT